MPPAHHSRTRQSKHAPQLFLHDLVGGEERGRLAARRGAVLERGLIRLFVAELQVIWDRTFRVRCIGVKRLDDLDLGLALVGDIAIGRAQRRRDVARLRRMANLADRLVLEDDRARRVAIGRLDDERRWRRRARPGRGHWLRRHGRAIEGSLGLGDRRRERGRTEMVKCLSTRREWTRHVSCCSYASSQGLL